MDAELLVLNETNAANTGAVLSIDTTDALAGDTAPTLLAKILTFINL